MLNTHTHTLNSESFLCATEKTVDRENITAFIVGRTYLVKFWGNVCLTINNRCLLHSPKILQVVLKSCCFILILGSIEGTA